MHENKRSEMLLDNDYSNGHFDHKFIGCITAAALKSEYYVKGFSGLNRSK